MKKIKLKKGLISQKIGNTINIFDGEKSTIYSFNQTATFIVERIKQGLSKENIISLVSKKYSVQKNLAEKDFNEFISELKSKKIIS